MINKADRVKLWKRQIKQRRVTTTVTRAGVTSSTKDSITGNIDGDDRLVLAGILIDYTKSVWFEFDAFTPVPKANDLITVNGSLHKILNTFTDSLDAIIRCDLGDENS